MIAISRARRHYHDCFRSMATSAVVTADATIARTSRLFIDNHYVEAENGERLPVISPVDGQVFASLAHASSRDVDRAVRAARRCFDTTPWRQGAEVRSDILRRVASALRGSDRLDALCVMESRDCGKTLAESKGDISFCADIFDYYADVAVGEMKAKPLAITGGVAGSFRAFTQPEALGVAACITPWNYPLMQAVVKVAPALAAGCTVVLKPSPLSSLTCCALGELFVDAGAPPGALNVVTGGPPEEVSGSSTGQSLIDHQLIDKVSFTGSGYGGRKMLEASAKFLRPTALELGGKSAFVIFEDSAQHLQSVVDWALMGIFANAGQICSATSRIIVHRNLEEELVGRLKEAIAKIRVGDPLEDGTQMGPVISASQQQKILTMIRQAASDGCTVHSAPLSLSARLQGGSYVPPTILTQVPPGAAAWRDEIFGPVLAVRSFSSEEEAIAMANDTVYGLANAVYSSDLDRCRRVAAQLKSGLVWENCSQVVFPETPFGGRIGKMSGFGHEYGLPGLKEFISEKTVVSSIDPAFCFGAYS